MSRARRVPWAPAVLAALLVGCVPPRTPTGPEAVIRADGVEVYGRADYRWPLRTLDGREVRLEEVRGRVLFINVWASWCAPCVAELAAIERLRASLAGAPVEFLLVSPEDAEPVERFLRRHPYDLPFYLERAPAPDAFGVRALPTTLVVDRAGDIVLRQRGAAEWDRDAVRDFLLSLTR